MELKDPKTIVDSVGDSFIELLEAGPRLGEKEGVILTTLASDFKSIAEDIKAKMPDDPSVLPMSLLKAGEAVLSGIQGTGESIAGAADETIKGIRSQIERITR